MTKFTTRVVLKDGDWDDYEVLYAAMERIGFTKFITGSNGKMYELPPAEYDYEGSIDITAVRDKAQAAADATGLKNSIFVTQSAGRAWIGLDPA